MCQHHRCQIALDSVDHRVGLQPEFELRSSRIVNVTSLFFGVKKSTGRSS